MQCTYVSSQQLKFEGESVLLEVPPEGTYTTLGMEDHSSSTSKGNGHGYLLFQNPHTGRWQMSTDLRNTYYHARLSCVATKHPNFSAGELQVDVKDSLNLYALNVLRQEFGLLV